MHVDISYAGRSRDDADAEAVRDIVDYLTPKQWDILLDAARLQKVEHLSWYFGMVGISGYPFHAFCRTVCLDKYREWMHEGDDAIMTDEQGFQIT